LIIFRYPEPGNFALTRRDNWGGMLALEHHRAEALPHINVGVESGYGAPENRDGSDFDNHRVAFGFQFF
jgi:hypothetical protein